MHNAGYYIQLLKALKAVNYVSLKEQNIKNNTGLAVTTLLVNTPKFAIAQGLMVSVTSLVVTSAALVGFDLAIDKSYATLPLAIMFIAIMVGTIPASFVLDKLGRKRGFLLATLIGMAGGFVSAYAIILQSFWLFVAGTFLFGLFNSFGNYFRFAAADTVNIDYKSRAISYVMLGGIVAAFVGPNLAAFAKNWLDGGDFVGSYAATVGLYILMFLSLSFLKLPVQDGVTGKENLPGDNESARPIREIAKQAKFILAILSAMLGYGVMSLVMTATPLAMRDHSHSFLDTSLVIQWHLLGMFVPSFFTGYLIRYLGVYKVLSLGVLLGFICIAVNLSGSSVTHFWLALVLLGMCWNFLFVGGTSLLTETYRQSERAKAQALNDFLVFSMATVGSLSAGYLQFEFGWEMVNLGVIPALMLVALGLFWIKLKGLKRS